MIVGVMDVIPRLPELAIYSLKTTSETCPDDVVLSLMGVSDY